MKSFPVAEKRPHSITQHGQVRTDNYYWMRDINDPETLRYLHAESDYLEGRLQHTKPLQAQLFFEMKARLKEDDASVPERKGAYYYYRRYLAGKQYPLFCRKKDSLDGDEEILLDQNELAKDHSFCSVSAFSVSTDGAKLAYSVDFGGREVYTLYIKNLRNGELFPETIGNTYGSAYEYGGVEWANDNETLFYATLDEAQRPDKLYRHKVGTDPVQDVLIFHEEDETFFLSFFKTHDDKYIFTYHYNTHSQEMRFLSADNPDSDLRILQPRVTGLEYFAAHYKGKFVIVHNENARNFKLSIAPIETPNRENWQEVIPHRAEVLVNYVLVFENHMVIFERKNGLKQLRISAPDGVSAVHYVKFPEPVYDVVVETNPEFKTKFLRFRYSSFTTPNSIVDYDMNTREWHVLKVEEIPSGYDRSQYVSEQIYATAPDGTQVPLSIVYKKGLPMDGNNPTLLYGYGSYGGSIDVSFSPHRLSLLNRGFIYAIGHTRGGSELGRRWYEDGILLKKKNVFNDFIACAEYLIQAGFTSNKRLAIIGGSAGGLLVSACMTMRPDLFGAVICKVPFLDVVTTMSDPTIPLTTLEYDEWGDPADKAQFDYMLSYSPYDNIRKTDYPNLLLTTGIQDPRVAYWEAAKFAAKLRELKTDDNLLLLYTNYASGHAGSSGRYDFLKEIALDYAFLLETVGK